MTSISEQARLALAAKGAAERDLARLAHCPPWRHAGFALLLAAIVATPALPVLLRFGVIVAVFAGIVLIVQWDRRRLGVFVNGYRRGRTRRVTFPLLAIFLGLYSASVYAAETLGRPVLSLVLSAAIFAVGYAGSVLWQKVFAGELGA